MEKNIIVVDENGKEIGATYPKRAKGLVKKGRARFTDENTICLACPAEETTEDEIMSDLKIDKATGEACEVTEYTKEQKQTSENEAPTLMYVLSQIEKIAADNAHISEALGQLNELKTAGPGDICGQSKADAIAHVVDAREDTNRKLIGFYEMLYKDIQSTEKSKNKIPSQLLEIIHNEEDYEARLEMFHDLCNFFA
ncbi:MAG: hypothetical protein IKU43_06455 [Clostridia bacterium]|nr:hypothetical protein [Clostridia bacterium]